jgi:hypothetical protein
MNAQEPAPPTGVRCPDCASSDVEVASLFGGSTSEMLLQCGACRSCFNWVKWEHKLPPHPF